MLHGLDAVRQVKPLRDQRHDVDGPLCQRLERPIERATARSDESHLVDHKRRIRERLLPGNGSLQDDRAAR